MWGVLDLSYHIIALLAPHVAQKVKGSASTTRHEGYAVSQKKRKRAEEISGWIKTVTWLRKAYKRVMRKSTGCHALGRSLQHGPVEIAASGPYYDRQHENVYQWSMS
jgi:hypothetical protein